MPKKMICKQDLCSRVSDAERISLDNVLIVGIVSQTSRRGLVGINEFRPEHGDLFDKGGFGIEHNRECAGPKMMQTTLLTKTKKNPVPSQPSPVAQSNP